MPPRLVIGHGAPGFWKAAGEVWPKTREQRCWGAQDLQRTCQAAEEPAGEAKRALQEIWMAETKLAAELASDAFIESYALKYEKAAGCLNKGSGHAAGFLRLPGRALETPADDQPHRKHTFATCETAPSDRRAGYPTRPRSRWSSN
ncbi:transposase [Bradyrhizobium canariense]|uniref:transposase n=1 Tax=Bradyrhizobium canariense TaxID=255045 RepID=UPI001FCE2901|nr:transposase [Bradyrhizobium canariense]